jgi:hypothetical protein
MIYQPQLVLLKCKKETKTHAEAEEKQTFFRAQVCRHKHCASLLNVSKTVKRGKKCKVRVMPYRPGQALRFSGGRVSQISK